MSTPTIEQSSGKKLSSKHYEVNNIFTPTSGGFIKGKRTLSEQQQGKTYPTNEKLSNVYEKYVIYNTRIQSYSKILSPSIPNDRADIIKLRKDLSIEKDHLRLNKNSSSLFNSSLFSTRDINSIKTKCFKSIEKEKTEVGKFSSLISKNSKTKVTTNY